AAGGEGHGAAPGGGRGVAVGNSQGAGGRKWGWTKGHAGRRPLPRWRIAPELPQLDAYARARDAAPIGSRGQSCVVGFPDKSRASKAVASSAMRRRRSPAATTSTTRPTPWPA